MNVLVWGLGISGYAAVNWLIKKSYSVVVLEEYTSPYTDLVKKKIGPRNFKQQPNNALLENTDFIVVSPGVSLWHPLYQMAVRLGIPIKTEVSLFLDEFPGFVIGITGTNGKSTLVSKLDYIAKELGLSACCAGNIGTPCLDLAEDVDYLVLELSSYHLAHGINSLDIGVLLNIAPDHLDWHKSYQHYYSSKQLITQCANYVIDCTSRDINSDEVLMIIAKKLSWPIDRVFEIAKTYVPLPHRLHRFSHLGKVWINDSKATNAHATLYACNKLKDEQVILILAGNSKGWLNDKLPNNVKHVILIGNISDWRIDIGSIAITEVNNLHDALEVAKSFKSKAVILFSPGGSSFDHYKNFAERGESFIKGVKCLS